MQRRGYDKIDCKFHEKVERNQNDENEYKKVHSRYVGQGGLEHRNTFVHKKTTSDNQEGQEEKD